MVWFHSKIAERGLAIKLEGFTEISESPALLSLDLKKPFRCNLTNCYLVVQIREGRFQTFDECLVREYRMSLQGVSRLISGDFYEVSNFQILNKHV